MLDQQPQVNLSFGQALTLVQQGVKIQREGWNGKGMWISYTDGRDLNASDFWNPHAKKFATENGGSAPVGAYLSFKSATGTIEMGWRPTSLDMFSQDWQVVND